MPDRVLAVRSRKAWPSTMGIYRCLLNTLIQVSKLPTQSRRCRCITGVCMYACMYRCIAGVMASNPVQAWIFFRPYFHYCLSSAHYCEDHFHSHNKALTKVQLYSFLHTADVPLENRIFGVILFHQFSISPSKEVNKSYSLATSCFTRFPRINSEHETNYFYLESPESSDKSVSKISCVYRITGYSYALITCKPVNWSHSIIVPRSGA